MSNEFSRRGLLQAAGGFTFFALAPGADAFVPFANGLADSGTDLIPVFTAIPYLQAGARASTLVEGQESMILAWQTDSTPAKFEVVYGKDGHWKNAVITRTPRNMSYKRVGDRTVNFTSEFENLNLGTRYQYRVKMNDTLLIEGYFTTRKPRGKKIRFVSFGDNSLGQISDRADKR